VSKPAAVVSAKPVVAAAPAQPKVEATRDRKAVMALIANLRSPEAEIARDAATTLASLPVDLEAIDALANVVKNTDGFYHPVVRAAAAATLGKLGAVRAIDALIVGTRDTMDEASQEAIRALGALGDARALPALQIVVDNVNGFYLEHVRKDAQAAIGRIGKR
jgi:HEAT repeat protein